MGHSESKDSSQPLPEGSAGIPAAPAAPGAYLRVHPALMRVTHWLNALAMLVMITSGWQIYNASPIFDFRFPKAITLGGWLAGGIQWHFAAMWLLVINGLANVIYGLASGHYRRYYLPVWPQALLSAFADALHGRLKHEVGVYNPVQRATYLGVLALCVIIVLSGAAIWKPVQLQELTALFGGYDTARLVHFLAMAAIVIFVGIHVVMVVLVPSTFIPMFTGRARKHAEEA